MSSAQAPGIPTAGLMEPSTPLAQEIYDEVVHWRKSFFKIPCGSVGKELVNELSSYINKYVQSGGDDTDALFYFSILPVLTLHRTGAKCTDKENSGHLQRRMRLWKSNDIQSLLEEGRSLQRSTGGRASGDRKRGQDDAARRFADCMTAGRVNEALKSLQPESTAGTLRLEDVVTSSDGSQATVRQLLQEKHPAAQAASPEVLLQGARENVHPIRFDSLTSSPLRDTALHCEGSAGPSGLDSACWRRMCSSFNGASTNMCSALSGLAHLLASSNVAPSGLVPFLACRLVALDKKPGVRPIGVGEVLRRIINNNNNNTARI